MIISVIILSVAGGVMTNWYGLNRQKQSPLMALPENTMIYYMGKEVCSALENVSEKKFWQNIVYYPSVRNVHHLIIRIDSVLRNHEDIYRYINNNDVILSLHKTAAQRIDILFIVPSKNRYDADKVKSLFQLNEKEKFASHSFRNSTIYTLYEKENEIKLAFSFVGGLLVMSPNTVLVEDAIRAYFNNINPVKKIGHSRNVVSKGDRIFINFSQVSSLLNIFLNEKGVLQTKDISYFASSGSFNYEITDEELFIRGNLNTSDSLSVFTNRFKEQTAEQTDIAKAVSQKTAVLVSYCLSDIHLFYENLLKTKTNIAEIKAFEQRNNLNINQKTLPLINKSIALTLTEPILDELSKSRAIWIKTVETGEATNHFYNKKGDRSPVTYNKLNIYPTQMADIFGLLFGKVFKMPAEAWFCVIRDYLVFSEDITILKNLSDDYIQGHTLSTSAEYAKTSEKLASDGNFLVYINPVRALNIPDIFLNDHWLKKYKSQNFLLAFGPIAFQMANIIGKTYAELIISQSDSKIRTLQKIWEFELDTLVASKPYITINHNNNKPEILIMDALTNLYLFSSEGELQWKKQIGSSLTGDIFLIDFYNNNKYQYLFATKNQLHCIDRLGRYVANYPIRIGNEAVTGLGVFIPPKGNQIKYFIATSNQCVYGYDLSAKPLNGWGAKHIDQNLIFPVSYLMSGSKLYFYGLTESGNVYIWDTKGNQIMNPVATRSGFKNPFYSQHGIDKDDSYLISLDTAGNTWKIYLNGKTEISKLSNWSKEAWFLYADINNDKKQELIFVDGSSLVCYSNEMVAMFSASLQSVPTSKPEIIMLKNEILISYFNEFNNKLYLSDLQGMPKRNFPVDCGKYYNFYDLNKDESPDVIGSFENKIFVARY